MERADRLERSQKRIRTRRVKRALECLLLAVLLPFGVWAGYHLGHVARAWFETRSYWPVRLGVPLGIPGAFALHTVITTLVRDRFRFDPEPKAFARYDGRSTEGVSP